MTKKARDREKKIGKKKYTYRKMEQSTSKEKEKQKKGIKNKYIRKGKCSSIRKERKEKTQTQQIQKIKTL